MDNPCWFIDFSSTWACLLEHIQSIFQQLGYVSLTSRHVSEPVSASASPGRQCSSVSFAITHVCSTEYRRAKIQTEREQVLASCGLNASSVADNASLSQQLVEEPWRTGNLLLDVQYPKSRHPTAPEPDPPMTWEKNAHDIPWCLGTKYTSHPFAKALLWQYHSVLQIACGGQRAPGLAVHGGVPCCHGSKRTLF